MIVISIYFIASFLLFLILNYVRKYHDELVHYGIVTGIYILIVTGLVTSIGIVNKDNFVYVIYLLELFIRIFYESVCKDANFFKEKDYILRYLVSFIIVFLLNVCFINHVEDVFPSMDQVRFMIWMGVSVYVVFLFKNDMEYFKKKKRALPVKDQNTDAIIMCYARLKNQYYKCVHSKYTDLIPIIYAIMIYEDRNRPEFIRKIDYYFYKISGKGRKFGIMQVDSKEYIDDVRSISITIKKLEKIYGQLKSKSDSNIISEYYEKNGVEEKVISILKIVKDFDKK